jgi:hypothetical protein
MACPVRDALVVAYFQAQTEQAKAATAMMNETAPDKHNSAVRRSATARMEVIACKNDLEAHCREHGCALHKV